MLGYSHYGIQISTHDMENVDFYLHTLGRSRAPERRRSDRPAGRAGVLPRPLRLVSRADAPHACRRSGADRRHAASVARERDDPPVQRLSAARYGTRPRQPLCLGAGAGMRGGERPRCGASASSRKSTSTLISCTTAGRVTSKRRSCGTEARAPCRASLFARMSARGPRRADQSSSNHCKRQPNTTT